MAFTSIHTGTGGVAINDIVTTWTNEFKRSPTEDSQVADFVEKLPSSGKFGGLIKARIIPAISAGSFNEIAQTNQTNMVLSALSTVANADTVVTGTAKYVYGAISVNKDVWNTIRDDSDYRANQKMALKLGMGEKLDTDVFANAFSLSNTITQADLDDAALRTGVGRLRKTAKNKAKLGEADIRLFLPPEEVANAMGIAAIKEYQIRGSLGAAATGSPVNAYGIKWDASGLVYTVGGVTAYAPLILKDAWFLCFNETPHPLADQVNGLTDNFIMVADYATNELFDSSGVVFVLTIP